MFILETHELILIQLYVNGNLVIDNWTRQRRGIDFFGAASIEEKNTYDLKANTKHDILVEFCNVRGPADGDEDEVAMTRHDPSHQGTYSVY